MSSSFEKSVKGGTKVKMAAPKSKYVEHLLRATRTGESGVGEVFRTLSLRLRDTTWTIVFKGLIIIHLMIREGEPTSTLRYLAENPSKMAINSFSDVQTQGGNIRHYHNYLLSRAKSFKDTKLDWVHEGKGRLKKQSVDKGLLRETESVQKQVSALLKCELFAEEPENEISLTAFRLLTMDLLVLYAVENEGAINVLERYFEMSKVDAERALAIYKTFSRQTDEVVKFLSTARKYENATRLQIPSLKHAPTSLTSSLEEYLNDPDFEVNRRQYLAQQEAKRTGRPVKEVQAELAAKKTNAGTGATPSTSAVASHQAQAKGPAPDLIDFFESIEQNQQPMNAPPQQQINTGQMLPQYGFQQFPAPNGQMPQQTGFQNGFPSTNPFAQMVAQQSSPPPQAANPFGQPQPQQQQFTGFNPQPSMQQQNHFNTNLSTIPQDQQASFQSQQQMNNNTQQQFPFSTGAQQQPTGMQQQQQPFGQSQQASPTDQNQQSSNPFRQSMMPQNTNSNSPFQSPPPGAPQGLQRQSTNPFARNVTSPTNQNHGSPFNSPPPGSQGGFAPQQLPIRTGTNPFARSSPVSNSQPGTTSPLSAQATGTNPFRQQQTAFINQQTGQGWQNSQGTMGGLENMNTVPVFPRPAGQEPFAQQQPQQPWS